MPTPDAPSGMIELDNGILIPKAALSTRGLEKLEKSQAVSAAISRAKAGQFFSYYRAASTQRPGLLDKPWDTPNFAFLRQIRRQSFIDSQIIETRRQQVKRFSLPSSISQSGMGYRVVHDRHYAQDFEITDDIAARCHAVEKIIQHTTPDFHQTFRDFLVSAVEEELVIDRKCMVRYTDGRGRTLMYHLVPGDTIMPVLQIVLPYARMLGFTDLTEAKESFSQELYDLFKVDIDLTDVKWVQVIDNRITGAWDEDEMSIDVTNPSVELNRWGFGSSLLERSVLLTRDHMKFWNFNTSLMDQRYPEALLTVTGDYDDEGLEVFRRGIAGESGDGNMWRLPIIAGGTKEETDIQVHKLRDTPKDMLFDHLLGRVTELKCGAYMMDPTEIGWSTMSYGGGSVMTNEKSRATEMAAAKENGLHGLLESERAWLTVAIVKTHDPDLQLVFEGLDEASEDARVERATKEVSSFVSLNEVRKKSGYSKLKIPDDLADLDPGNIPLNPVFMQALQLRAQDAMMKSQQAQYSQGDFGDSAGGGGPPGPPGQDAGNDVGGADGGSTGSASAGQAAMPGSGAPAGPAQPPAAGGAFNPVPAAAR